MTGSIIGDTNPKYWKEYTNLQHVKHSLIRNYLNGWFPMLGSWAGRILYFDTHAGRGKHKGGQKGSPLVALDCVLSRYCQMLCTALGSDPVYFNTVNKLYSFNYHR